MYCTRRFERVYFSGFDSIRIVDYDCTRARLSSGGTSMLRSIVFRRFAIIFPVMVILAIAVLSPSKASAQVSGAALSGTITDPSGAAVPNAKVTITNTATGVTRDDTTDAAGFFSVPNLLPGPYAVTVSSPGFSTIKSSDIVLTVGAAQTLNLSLKLG